MEFLEDRLDEEEFNEKKNDLDDLVKTCTGGKFKTLTDVVKTKDNLKGLSRIFSLLYFSLLISTLELEKKVELREEAKRHLKIFYMHRNNKELKQQENDAKQEKEERWKTRKAFVMKKVGNHIVKHEKIDHGLVKSMIGGTAGEEELRRSNVFAYHHSGDFYSFSTRALKNVYKV